MGGYGAGNKEKQRDDQNAPAHGIPPFEKHAGKEDGKNRGGAALGRGVQACKNVGESQNPDVSGDAEKLRRTLIENYSTGTIAQDNVLRIAFSSTPYQMIEKLFDNCYRAAQECQNQ